MGSILDEPPNTLDYIAIGDSECNTSISPMEIWRKYGFAGYNCGASAQLIQQTYYQLDKALRNQSPKAVLLETNNLFRTLGFVKVAQDMISQFVGRGISLYQNHDEWKRLLFPGGKGEGVNRSDVFKGFQYYNSVDPYTGGPYINRTDKIHAIGATQRFYLEKIVSLCRERGIQLILYCVPSPVCWTYQRHNGVKRFAEERSLPFLDLNLIADELGIDWARDTIDKGDHVNFAGAQKVTEYIGAYLNQNTSARDHRGDSAYTEWNERLREYLDQTCQQAD